MTDLFSTIRQTVISGRYSKLAVIIDSGGSETPLTPVLSWLHIVDLLLVIPTISLYPYHAWLSLLLELSATPGTLRHQREYEVANRCISELGTADLTPHAVLLQMYFRCTTESFEYVCVNVQELSTDLIFAPVVITELLLQNRTDVIMPLLRIRRPALTRSLLLLLTQYAVTKRYMPLLRYVLKHGDFQTSPAALQLIAVTDIPGWQALAERPTVTNHASTTH